MVAYDIVQHAHSILRWVVLLLLIFSIVRAWRKLGAGEYHEGDRKLALFTMIATHLQFVLGLVLYFVLSPHVRFADGMMADPVLRFYTIEHTFIMLIAIGLITIGHGRARRAVEPRKKFRAIVTFYGLGLVLILIGIPWPFRIPEAGWL